MTIQCLSCLILDMFLLVLLIGRCPKCIRCIELLADVTTIVNFESQTDVGVLLILSILKACFYVWLVLVAVLSSSKYNLMHSLLRTKHTSILHEALLLPCSLNLKWMANDLQILLYLHWMQEFYSSRNQMSVRIHFRTSLYSHLKNLGTEGRW